MFRKVAISFVFTLITVFLIILATYSWAYYGTFNLEAMGIASQLLFGSLPGLIGFIVRMLVLVGLIVLFRKAIVEQRVWLALVVVVVAFILWSLFGLRWFALPTKGIGMLGLLIVLSLGLTAVNALIFAPRAPRMERPEEDDEDAASRPSMLTRFNNWRRARQLDHAHRTIARDTAPAPQPAPSTTTQTTAVQPTHE